MIIYNGGDFRDYLKNVKVSHRIHTHQVRMIERIKVGNYYFSIQGSYGHNAIPKLTFKNIFTYANMEVAIFDEPIANQDCNINLDNSNLFDDFSKYNELSTYYNEGRFDCVPIDLIQDLVQYFLLLQLNIK